MKSIVVNEMLHRRNVNRHVTLKHVPVYVLCGRLLYVHAGKVRLYGYMSGRSRSFLDSVER